MSDANILAELSAIRKELLALRAETAGVDPEFMVPEAAKVLRLSSRTVWRLIHTKKLGYYRHGEVRVTVGASHIRAYQESTGTLPRVEKAS